MDNLWVRYSSVCARILQHTFDPGTSGVLQDASCLPCPQPSTTTRIQNYTDTGGHRGDVHCPCVTIGNYPVSVLRGRRHRRGTFELRNSHHQPATYYELQFEFCVVLYCERAFPKHN